MLLPKAHKEGLVIQELADETLVYDTKRHRAYCLNQTASLVWRHCDGATTSEQMAAILGDELPAQASDDLLVLALDQLERARLVERRAPRDVARDLSRRELMRRLAVAGAVALVPAVLSVLAPMAAQAATCVTSCVGVAYGTPCNPTQCNKICCGPGHPKFPNQCKATC